MKIAQQLGIADIERYAEELERSLGSVDLTFPAGVRSRGAGGEVSLAQLLLTWANRSSSRRLILTGSMEPEAYFDRIAERLPGQLAALVCTSAQRLRDASDHTRRMKDRTERAIVTSYYKPFVDKGNISGGTINIICADSSGFGEPRVVYLEDDVHGTLRVKDLFGFVRLTNQAFSSLLQGFHHRKLTVDRDFVKAAASLLYELFSNTHDHARTSFDGKPLEASYRGFQLRITSAEDRVWADAAGDYQPLRSYIDALPALEQRNRQLLEISVFDAGPGFAQKITKTPLADLSSAAEREAVNACFGKGVTTKSHVRYGQGLPQVISLLRSRHGFIRLRTGRLSLSRDLGLEVDWPRDEVPAFAEWTPPGLKHCSALQGSSLTVLMPVARVSQ